MTELSDYLYLDHDTCYMLLLAIYNMDDHMAERILNAETVKQVEGVDKEMQVLERVKRKLRDRLEGNY